jgi:hypothetical protein
MKSALITTKANYCLFSSASRKYVYTLNRGTTSCSIDCFHEVWPSHNSRAVLNWPLAIRHEEKGESIPNYLDRIVQKIWILLTSAGRLDMKG